MLLWRELLSMMRKTSQVVDPSRVLGCGHMEAEPEAPGRGEPCHDRGLPPSSPGAGAPARYADEVQHSVEARDDGVAEGSARPGQRGVEELVGRPEGGMRLLELAWRSHGLLAWSVELSIRWSVDVTDEDASESDESLLPSGRGSRAQPARPEAEQVRPDSRAATREGR